LPQNFIDGGLAREGTFDEHGLAVAVSDAAAFLVERFNPDFESFAAHDEA
jgi:hypothetical protein